MVYLYGGYNKASMTGTNAARQKQPNSTKKALRKKEDHYRRLVEFSPNGTAVYRKGKLVYVNLVGATLLGAASPEELIGKPLLSFVHPDYVDFVKRRIQKIQQEKKVEFIEEKLVRLDGQEVDVEVGAAPITYQGKSAMLIIIHDITERKRAEEALKSYAAQLEEANCLKVLFSDMLHHDLLNPAGIIANFADILLDEAKDEDTRNSAIAIKRNAHKLIELIESASMYAKLESVQKLERKRRDLNEVFKTVANSFKPLLKEKNMKLEYMPKNACHAIVNPMFESVFSNLLSNAIKYSPEGSKIEAGIVDEGSSWKIYVKDWGYGINDENKAKIFTRFQRADKSGTKGTGLGLAIVKRLAELHEGRVWVEDNPEGGSIFYVELPKCQ